MELLNIHKSTSVHQQTSLYVGISSAETLHSSTIVLQRLFIFQTCFSP
jgi:hypothetical protein